VATPVSPGHRPHKVRFVAFYGLLGLLAVGAIGIGVHVATEKKPHVAGPWSGWRPTTTDVKAVEQIADFVGKQYVDSKGKELIDVRGTPLIMGSKQVQIAVRKDANSRTVASVAGTSVEYNMCGSTDSCVIPSGAGVTANAASVLTRREAYELALYTFKYVPQVSNVVVLTPPTVNKSKARAIFIRRDDVARALDADSLELPGAATRATHVSQRDALLIAKTTDPFVFQWILADVGSTPTLVINPVSLNVKNSLAP
jgi:hypothetical protein